MCTHLPFHSSSIGSHQPQPTPFWFSRISKISRISTLSHFSRFYTLFETCSFFKNIFIILLYTRYTAIYCCNSFPHKQLKLYSLLYSLYTRYTQSPLLTNPHMRAMLLACLILQLVKEIPPYLLSTPSLSTTSSCKNTSSFFLSRTPVCDLLPLGTLRQFEGTSVERQVPPRLLLPPKSTSLWLLQSNSKASYRISKCSEQAILQKRTFLKNLIFPKEV